MAAQRTPQVPQPPKRSHYVSMHNSGIYPAMTSPPGWEDEHPEDWRPASPEEVAKFKAGIDSVKIEAIDLTPDESDTPPEAALPHAIQLAAEDPEPAANIPPAPAPVMSRTV
jgi:hypothetical protein